MLTYTSFCISLYRWVLTGSDFENYVYRVHINASPDIGERYQAATLKNGMDSVHIIFFCFYWNPISWEVNQASLIQKVAARWCSPIRDLATPYCLLI